MQLKPAIYMVRDIESGLYADVRESQARRYPGFLVALYDIDAGEPSSATLVGTRVFRVMAEAVAYADRCAKGKG